MTGGNAKTLMLAHISPEGESYVETLSTLKFAQRVSTVELGTAHANKESNDIRELKEQVDFPCYHQHHFFKHYFQFGTINNMP